MLVVGFRLGALLVPAAVAGRDDVAGLALLAPPASGKTYVRELTGLSRMIDAALPPAPNADEAAFDGVTVAGFRMSAETIAALRMAEWRDALEALRPPRLLMMPRASAPELSALAGRLEAAGSVVTATPFEGYDGLMCNPTANDIPQATLDAAVGWIAGHAVPRHAEAGAFPAPGPLQCAHFQEWPLVIDPAPEICGVLCLPVDGTSREVALILNAGAVPHVGWARGTVETARALAAEGVASLRIDLPGLGQSGTPAEKRLFLYDQRGRADVTRALDWLERAGFAEVCAVGTCSGAFQAFHAARHDARITRLTMVNPLCFAWNKSYALDMGVWKAYKNSRAALGKVEAAADEAAAADAAMPRRALRGLVMRGAQRLIRFSLELAKSAASRLSLSRMVRGRPVERWMAALTARGARVMMVSCEGDLSLEEIVRHFGPGGERLWRMEGVTKVLLPAADHTLTPVHARRMLTEDLARFMGAPVRGKAASASRPPRAERSHPAAGTSEAALLR